jgi:truncated hemoglobin YjbI
MEHRRFLAHAEAQHPFAGTDLLDRIGGRAVVDALVDGLYDGIETDGTLRPLFGRELGGEREAQKRFFTEWLGGASVYSDRAYLPLKHRHDLLPITRARAERWLGHFCAAIDRAVADLEARRAITDKVRGLAMALVNEGPQVSELRAKPHGVCLRYEPAIESVQLARRGDAASLRRLLARAPGILVSVPLAARLLHVAALGGREGVIDLLLDAGVDVDKPSALEPLIFITPLCAARAKRRSKVESRLLRRGAQEDIFTHAFLGDLDRLHGHIRHDPRVVQALDPAVDALQVTPVHHAVAGGQVEALRVLLAGVTKSAEPLIGAVRALRDATARANVAMVAMLLEHGASATSIGAGRWVLHPELAAMLARAGRASIDRGHGSGRRAPATRAERTIRFTWRRSCVMARG